MDTRIILIACKLSLLLFLTAMPPAHARVSRSWSAAASLQRTLAARGGQLAYQSEIQVNGTAGSITVLSMKQSLHETVDFLQPSFPGGTLEYRGGAMARASRSESRGHQELLLLEFEPNRCVLMMIETENRAPENPPDAAVQSFPLPVYPGAIPTLLIHTQETEASLLLSESIARPADIVATIRSLLHADGWEAALPGHRQTDMLVFLRPHELAILYVTSHNHHARSQITLLHKSLSVD